MTAPRRLPKPLDGRALFQRITSREALLDGWHRVWTNRGAAGGDGVTCERFAFEATRRLDLLSAELRGGTYRPGPLRHVDIPKRSGGVRRLTIPSIRDRVAQSSAAAILTPLLDREFEETSFGYRPGRGVREAVEKARRLRADGYIWTVDADIERYFDSIPHDKLTARVLRSITESPLTELIALWLETGAEGGRGVPQGSPLSPLLSNLYLDDLDEALAERGLRLVRFADDFIILTKDKAGAEKALDHVARVLKEQGLALHRDKTRIRGFDDTLRFLGHLFVRSWVMADPDREETGADALIRELAERDRRDAKEEERLSERDRQEDAAGYDRGLSVLYLREPGRELSLRSRSFAVMEDPDGMGPAKARLLIAVHPNRVDRIEIGPRAGVTTEALKHALASGVPVAFVNGHGETLGTLAGSLAPRAGRHLAQARHRLDEVRRLDLARRIVEGRLKNERALLRRLNQRRGSDEAVAVLLSLNRTIRKLPEAGSVEQLLGFEGSATAGYWRAWSALLLHGFSLPARVRESVRDPVNVALNMAASLLSRDIGAIVAGRGLHPGVGILHGCSDGEDGCAHDLMEEFRAHMVEGLVLYLFNNRALDRDMFSAEEGGFVRMGNEAGATIIRGYEERAASLVKSPRSGNRVTWRRLMIEQAEAYAAHVEDRAPYRPYVMDY